jgi:dihydroorotate dehydrogenase
VYPGLNIAEFAKAVIERLKGMGYPNPRKTLADKVGVEDSTVGKWISGDTGRAHSKSLQALVDFAAHLGVFPEEYSHGPVLWPPNQPYEEMLVTPQGHVIFPPPRLDRVPQPKVFGRTLQSPFGVVAGPATAHLDWCFHLLDAGVGFVELKTVVDVDSTRPPKNEPTLLCFVSPLTSSALPNVRSGLFRPRTKLDDLARSGVGTNLGLPCPASDEWVQAVKDLIAHSNEHQIVLPSVTGCPWLKDSESDFIASLVTIAKRAVLDAGSHFIVVNASCGALDNYLMDPERLLKCILAVKQEVGAKTQILLKLGAWCEEHTTNLLSLVGPYVNGVIAINSIPHQAYVQSQRVQEEKGIYGVSGSPIRADAARTIDLLHRLMGRSELQHLVLIACGGVASPGHVSDYLDKGILLVGSQTAVLQDPYFIWKVHGFLGAKQLRQQDRADQAEEVVAAEFGKALLHLSRKYPELSGSSLGDGDIMRIFRQLLVSRESMAGVRRARTFRYAHDILTQLEQTMWRNQRKKNES